MQFDMGLLIII